MLQRAAPHLPCEALPGHAVHGQTARRHQQQAQRHGRAHHQRRSSALRSTLARARPAVEGPQILLAQGLAEVYQNLASGSLQSMQHAVHGQRALRQPGGPQCCQFQDESVLSLLSKLAPVCVALRRLRLRARPCDGRLRPSAPCCSACPRPGPWTSRPPAARRPDPGGGKPRCRLSALMASAPDRVSLDTTSACMLSCVAAAVGSCGEGASAQGACVCTAGAVVCRCSLVTLSTLRAAALAHGVQVPAAAAAGQPCGVACSGVPGVCRPG